MLRSLYAIQVKIWKLLKLLNSVPFHKKTFVNHVYIGIWSFWLTFTVLQWMKKIQKLVYLKISPEMYAIHVKIWKCLKLNNPVPFIKKTLEKSSWHSNLINLTDFHSVAVNEDKLQNQSIIRFLLRLVYAILVKIWKWLKLLNSFHSSRKHL